MTPISILSPWSLFDPVPLSVQRKTYYHKDLKSKTEGTGVGYHIKGKLGIVCSVSDYSIERWTRLKLKQKVICANLKHSVTHLP